MSHKQQLTICAVRHLIPLDAGRVAYANCGVSEKNQKSVYTLDIVDLNIGKVVASKDFRYEKITVRTRILCRSARSAGSISIATTNGARAHENILIVVPLL